MVPEARLERTAGGLAPVGEWWFVPGARDARWPEGDFGAFTRLEGDARFHIGVLAPGVDVGYRDGWLPRKPSSTG
jgi:hypothetical protein